MKVAIVGHRRPDGDAIGAMFGMREYVKTRIPTVKEISLVVPDPIPDNAAWLPLLEDVLVGDEEKIREANLIICCDFSIPSRAGSLEKAIRESHADYKWSVDHHDNPDTDFWDDIICKPDYSSTCEVVMDLVRLEDCSKEVLTHLMNGIVTDTKNLDREGDCKSNPREAIKTLETWGSLSRDVVARKSLWEKSREGFILEAYILENTFFPSPSIAILTLTLEERHKFGYRPGMTDNIIERVLAIRDRPLLL